MPAIRFLLKALAVLVAALVTGLAFGILPCYVFPIFGTSEREWCGYKSGPPHFDVQFVLGAAVGSMTLLWRLLRKAGASPVAEPSPGPPPEA